MESATLVSSAMAAPRQPLDNDDDDNDDDDNDDNHNDDNQNNADAQGRGHYHNRRRQQHEPNDAGRPVYDNATRSRLIAAERERINDRRQHARGTGKLDVPPDIADGEVDFAVTSSLSGRRALSALARHSVQDVRDERCVRACALGCSDQCNHGMRAFDAVAAARAQRDVDISTLSTRTLRRRAWRATARNQSAPFAGATEVGRVRVGTSDRADVCARARTGARARPPGAPCAPPPSILLSMRERFQWRRHISCGGTIARSPAIVRVVC